MQLRFDESVGLGEGYVRVIDAGGRRVETGSTFHPSGHDDIAAVRLRAGLGASAYLVSYRVVSADSHVVGGSVRFTVGDAPAAGSTVAAGPTTPRSIGTTLDVVRLVSYLGLLAAAGTWLLLVGVTPTARTRRVGRRVLLTGAGVTVVAALVQVWLQAAYAAGQWSGLRDGAGLRAAVGSGFGWWHLAQIGATAVATAAMWWLLGGRRSPTVTVIGGAAAVAAVVCLTAPGHASGPPWPVLGVASTSLHVAAMSVWVGGLLWLVVTARGHEARRWPFVMPLFSRVALVAVGVIVATGLFQAIRELRGWSPLVDGTYGRLLLVKTSVVIVIVVVASVSRSLVRAGRLRGTAVRQIRRGIAVEVALAVVVLAVTSVLVAEPPRPTVADTAAPLAAVSGSAAISVGRRVTLTVSPARSGSVTVELQVGAGVPVQQLTVTATQPAAQVGPLGVPFGALHDGHARAAGVLLPVAGAWRFEITVRTSQFDASVASITVTLR